MIDDREIDLTIDKKFHSENDYEYETLKRLPIIPWEDKQEYPKYEQGYIPWEREPEKYYGSTSTTFATWDWYSESRRPTGTLITSDMMMQELLRGGTITYSVNTEKEDLSKCRKCKNTIEEEYDLGNLGYERFCSHCQIETLSNKALEKLIAA